MAPDAVDDIDALGEGLADTDWIDFGCEPFSWCSWRRRAV